MLRNGSIVGLNHGEKLVRRSWCSFPHAGDPPLPLVYVPLSLRLASPSLSFPTDVRARCPLTSLALLLPIYRLPLLLLPKSTLLGVGAVLPPSALGCLTLNSLSIQI